MSRFFIVKLEWEYGEQYGHVLFPQNLPDLQNKIDELDRWGREQDYPFLVTMSFTDERLYLGFTVGHEYSGIEFMYDIDRAQRTWQGPFYLRNKLGNRDEIIPIYYKTSYTELDTTRMLPYHQVVAAVRYFIEHQMFPAYIQFEDDEVNQRWKVAPSC